MRERETKVGGYTQGNVTPSISSREYVLPHTSISCSVDVEIKLAVAAGGNGGAAIFS